MLLIGVAGTELTVRERAWLQHDAVAGVVLFKRNFASRAQVTGSQRVEFLAMGLLAGILATAGAAAIGQLLARQIFELDLPPSAGLWIAGPLAGLLLLSLNAWLSARKVLSASPALTLRDSV